MEAETKTLLWVFATIVLIVASSFAGVGYLANHDIAAKAGPALAQAADVRLMEQRADILLMAAVAFWLAACAVFARIMPHQPGSTLRPYMVSFFIVTAAVGVTVMILHFTATFFKLL